MDGNREKRIDERKNEIWIECATANAIKSTVHKNSMAEVLTTYVKPLLTIIMHFGFRPNYSFWSSGASERATEVYNDNEMFSKHLFSDDFWIIHISDFIALMCMSDWAQSS